MASIHDGSLWGNDLILCASQHMSRVVCFHFHLPEFCASANTNLLPVSDFLLAVRFVDLSGFLRRVFFLNGKFESSSVIVMCVGNEQVVYEGITLIGIEEQFGFFPTDEYSVRPSDKRLQLENLNGAFQIGSDYLLTWYDSAKQGPVHGDLNRHY